MREVCGFRRIVKKKRRKRSEWLNGVMRVLNRKKEGFLRYKPNAVEMDLEEYCKGKRDVTRYERQTAELMDIGKEGDRKLYGK